MTASSGSPQRVSLAAGFIAALFLFAAGQVLAEPARQIFVSIPPQRFLLERIVGTLGTVQVFIEPGQVPETYEPRPSRLKLLKDASIYFSIGVPFEKPLLERIRRQYPRLQVVDCCAVLLPGDAGSNPDPHIWTSPRLIIRYAELVHDVLSRIDAGNRYEYDSNYRELNGELVTLQQDMRTLLRERRFDEFIIDHAGLGPLAEEFNLKQVALEQGGREPSARSLAGVIDLAKSRHIKTIFTQKQHQSATIGVLAGEIGANITVIDLYGENYLDNMRSITRSLGEALK